MYCTKCNRFTDSDVCPECGEKTVEEAPHVVYWCDDCRVPIIQIPSGNHSVCPRCGGDTRYLCTDLRPVFPEERLLFEVMTGEAFAHRESSVWASGSKYYVDGAPVSISVADILASNPEAVRSKLELASGQNDYAAFSAHS